MHFDKKNIGIIDQYKVQQEHYSQQDYEDAWQAIEAYNQSLQNLGNRFELKKGKAKDALYVSLLNMDHQGTMGYLEIPDIEVLLPIYHGTSEEELTAGVGHLEGSSLPSGGIGNHVILSSHSGYPGAKLFTHLDRLKIGSYFTIHVLDRHLTYKVDQIVVVLPDQTEELMISPDKDYVTLFTCTPYGVNSHRLLVRGVRAK